MATKHNASDVSRKRNSQSRCEASFSLLDQMSEISQRADAIDEASATLCDAMASRTAHLNARRQISASTKALREVTKDGKKNIVHASPEADLLYQYKATKDLLPLTPLEEVETSPQDRQPFQDITNNYPKHQCRLYRSLVIGLDLDLLLLLPRLYLCGFCLLLIIISREKDVARTSVAVFAVEFGF